MMRQTISITISLVGLFVLIGCSEPAPVPNEGTNQSEIVQNDEIIQNDEAMQNKEAMQHDAGVSDTKIASSCQSDKDCALQKQVCHRASGRCVDCLRKSDCPSQHTCRRFRCFQDISCQSTKTCPNEQVCDTQEQRCVECVVPEDCPKTAICVQGACTPQPAPCVSDKDCKSEGQVCDPDQKRCTDCLQNNDCEELMFCQNKLCVEALCQAKTIRCVGQGEKREICTDNGEKWMPHTPCQSNEFCEEGQCKPVACTPGQKKCINEALAVCNADGKSFGNPTPCPTGQFCAEDQCKALACQPNTKQCKDSSTREICKSDGKGWDASPCQANQICEQGDCKDKACSPGEKACLHERSAQTCASDGLGWVKKDCQTDEICDMGDCKKKICTPLQISCADSATVQTCDAKGLSFTKNPCEKDKVCEQGKCIFNACKPGDKKCQGNEVHVCQSDASGYTKMTTCATDQKCVVDTCVALNPVVSTFAGDGIPGSTDGSGTTARFNGPSRLAMDSQGNVYVSDQLNGSIRKITPSGTVSTFVTGLSNPAGIAIDSSGNLYVAENNAHKIKIVNTSGFASTFAGTGTKGTKNGLGNVAEFSVPNGMIIDTQGNLYVGENGSHLIRKITPQGVVSTFAGAGEGYLDGPVAQAKFKFPALFAFDAQGNLLVADAGNNRIRKISQTGMVSTFAGSGVRGHVDGPALSAQFYEPTGLDFDQHGNLYVAESGHWLRMISPAGAVTTFSGTGVAGYKDGPAANAQFNNPHAILFNLAKELLIAERGNHRIRKVTW